jgi:hypothetical protein
MHIRAMRAALDEHLAGRSELAVDRCGTAEEPPVAPKADYGVTGEEQPTDCCASCAPASS